MNLSEKIFPMIYGITARTAFGEKCKDEAVFISTTTELYIFSSGSETSSTTLEWAMSYMTCEVKGYEIVAKTRVLINAWAIGRDPNYWPDAERFSLNCSMDYMGRHFGFIPFGAGRRIYLGILFGVPNVLLPLAQLFHFDWKLPDGMKQENLGITVGRKMILS
ncbi:hypothetical protein PTKIN_Ptkin14bG0014800 [Pterospermum kingtungense]